jgi:hypothetical protein
VRRPEPPRHVGLHGGRPRVVVRAVQDEHRQARGLELLDAVGLALEVEGHPDEGGRVGGEHAVAQEALGRGVEREEPGVDGVEGVHGLDHCTDALRCQLAQRSQDGRARTGQPGWTGAHQRQRAERLGAPQDGRAGHQAAEAVADEVHGARAQLVDHRQQVPPERLDRVGRRVVRTR